MDEVTSFDIISIKIASPQVIKSWSKGEVRKAETINYRTLKPEKDGLFCEKIFGPVRDWECNCGKYKGIKFKGITCDRCGVTVDRSSVRRERMGHIELAAPVTHIWFFKAVPSRLSGLLDIGLRDLDKVIYYEEYVVVDPGTSPLKKRELLTEEEYQDALVKYGANFKAKIGAEAVRDLLKELDMDSYCRSLRRAMEKSKEALGNRKALKSLKIVEDFKKSGNKPEWMILDIVPDLRRDSGSTRYYPGRDEEIKAWLEQHPEVEKFAILDDVDLEQMEGLEEHFFQTEFEEGLTHEQSLKIIKHLSNN